MISNIPLKYDISVKIPLQNYPMHPYLDEERLTNTTIKIGLQKPFKQKIKTLDVKWGSLQSNSKQSSQQFCFPTQVPFSEVYFVGQTTLILLRKKIVYCFSSKTVVSETQKGRERARRKEGVK